MTSLPDMTKLFLSELRTMLAIVERKLSEIDGNTSHDAWGPRYTETSQERRKILLRRKRELEEKIINFEV